MLRTMRNIVLCSLKGRIETWFTIGFTMDNGLEVSTQSIGARTGLVDLKGQAVLNCQMIILSVPKW